MSIPKIRQHDAQSLAHGYDWKVRTLEVSSITVYGAIMAALAWKLFPFALKNPWLVGCAFLTGYFGADWVSGFVHWLADTWGHLDMPIVGKAFLRPFREHHVDQQAITRHDFIETNGNNCLISIPGGFWALCLEQHDGGSVHLFLASFWWSLILWVMFTNQFHKWSHLTEPKGWVAFLQRTHLILPVDHHQVHHTAPFNKSYSITAGWMNYPLNWIGFYPFLERCVTAATGILPRRDDIGERAAMAVVEETKPPEGSEVHGLARAEP